MKSVHTEMNAYKQDLFEYNAIYLNPYGSNYKLINAHKEKKQPFKIDRHRYRKTNIRKKRE